MSLNQITQLYVGYFGRAPDPVGLQYWLDQNQAGMSISDIAASFAVQTEATTQYPYLSAPEVASATTFITSVYQNLFGRTPDADGLTYWTAQLTADSSPAAVAQFILNVISGAKDDTNGDDLTTLNNKTTVALDWAQDAGNVANLDYENNSAAQASAGTILDSVDGTTATVTTAQASTDTFFASAITGTTSVLTTGIDTFTGGTTNDSFTADQGTAVIGNLDTLDGGDGTDTLTIVSAGGNVSLGEATTTPTMSNIENVVATTGLAAGTVTVNTTSTNITGVTSITASATEGAVDIDTNGDATSVSVTNGVAVAIDDNATTNTLATVSITGVGNTTGTNTKTITSTALTSLSLTDITGAANSDDADDITATSTGALALSLNNVSIGDADILAATATSATVSTSGSSAIVVGDLDLGAATTVSIASDAATTIAALDIATATGLTMTGTAALTLTAGTYTALTAFDASGNSGGVTLTQALATDDAFTGGSGADTVTIGTSTVATAMGAGNDRVVSDGTIGTGGTIDGGADTDTIAMTAAQAATASGATTFGAAMSNFEVLELTGGTGTVDMANLDSLASITVSGGLGGALTINNAAANTTLTYTVDAAAATAISYADASGSSDVLNLAISGAAAVDANTITANGIETIAISTDDTAATPVAVHVANISADAVTSMTVSGDAGLTLTNTSTTITSFDASGVTGGTGAVTWTTGALAAASTITGSATHANTITASAAAAAVTYTGGSGVDTVVIANANANVINTAAGDDLVTMGSGNQTINLGDGADTLTVGTVTTQTSSITLGAGNDTVDVNAIQGSAGAYLSLQDAAAGDIIDVAGIVSGTIAGATLGTATTLGGAATFANYLDAIAAGDGSTNEIDGWFQLGGNTYLVIDNSAGATFQDGVDTVIELVGTIDLTNTTQAAGVYTIV